VPIIKLTVNIVHLMTVSLVVIVFVDDDSVDGGQIADVNESYQNFVEAMTVRADNASQSPVAMKRTR